MKFKTYAWNNGKEDTSKLVEIELPEVCCGIKTEIDPIYLGKNRQYYFTSACTNHMSTFPELWKNFGEKNNLINNKGNGHKCIGCGDHNPYAEANLSYSKYKCYSCKIWGR